MLTQNVQIIDIHCKTLEKNELERVKGCKNVREISRRLEKIYENKYLNPNVEKKECSTSSSYDEENIDDVTVKRIV